MMCKEEGLIFVQAQGLTGGGAGGDLHSKATQQ